MRRAAILLLLLLSALSPGAFAANEPAAPTPEEAGGQPIPADGLTLDQFQWSSRLVIVFADTPRDPAFARQLELLAQRPADLVERGVVVLTDSDPAAMSPIRSKLHPHGFALVIVDKDGAVMLRKPLPWDVREIVRAIDKTPLRQQEMRDLRDAERSVLDPAGH